MTTDLPQPTAAMPVLCCYELRWGFLDWAVTGAKMIHVQRSSDIPYEFDIAMRRDIAAGSFGIHRVKDFRMTSYLPYCEMATF